IMSDTTEYDANTGYALKKIPSGYLYSARLGDEITSADRAPRCWEQSLRYTMKIDSSNALLILKFALVLQYIAAHAPTDEPRFRLTLYDSQGNILPDCSNYDVYATNKYVKGFKTYIPSGSSVPVEWRDWTTVGVNLLKYIGQTVTVEFMSADCAEQYHYGYAYFVAECHPLYISVKYCASDTAASLIAPEGFEKYRWTDINGTLLDSLQILQVNVPDQKLSYSCTMTSATGCVVSLHTSIVKYIPHADFSSFMIDCHSNTVQMIDLSSTNHGSLSYNWYFEDGNTSDNKDPPCTFSTSGMHTVTLILNNLPSACSDTLTKDIESFSPPLVGITGDSTYCPGLSTWIKAYGAVDYTWNNGSKADSIEISAPGGEYWLLGRSSTGCVSDTIYKPIIEEPDWTFLMQGDTSICGSGSVTLSASGAISYLWDKGNTNDTISVSDGGTYIVTGTNTRGCKKSATFRVTVYQLPSTEFSVSPDVIDRKNNIVRCNIPAQTGVTYAWAMGDGSYGSGEIFQHGYNVSYTPLYYLVTLTATDKQNCTDSSFKYVDVIPFIPNVFTPDGDGTNDIFMPGFELEIVDRNGMRIHKGNDGWDGRNNGRSASPDTYFYMIYYKDSKEIIRNRKGYVTLIR
ncbi:MAG: PKD domain-containing protein, partial [Bacteroidia bacterium]|nr:PKD domain-containing protein [Bacteroidia bacterium]